jgi:ATP-binding cassette, subfamily B, bacterial
VARLSDLDRIRAAARDAEIDDRLAALPQGYATLLSRRLSGLDEDPAAAPAGAELSGGEWQRVALARSMVRTDADLLILDEPSSGLDAAAEFRLNRAIEERGRGRTRLLISHRLSALRRADRIAVLCDGRIAEEGTHDLLMHRGGAYADLFKLQALGYQDPRVATGPAQGVA